MPQGDYTPDQWKTIARNAKAALDQNPNDREAGEWLGYAQEALRARVAAMPSREQVEAEERRAAAPNTRESLGLGFSRGASFGIGDEAAGLVEGLGAALIPGGRGFREGYREGRDEVRQATDLAQEAHPIATTVGDVGSMLIPGPKAAQAVLRAAPQVSRIGRIASRVGRAAGLGAAESGLQAAGRTDGGIRERAGTAIPAAIAGGVVGGALPIAAGVARQAMDPLLRFGSKAVDRIAGPAAKAATRTRTPPVRARQLPVRGEVRAGFERDPLDTPTFMRRAAEPGASPPTATRPTDDKEVLRRALEAATERGHKVVPAGPTQRAAPATRMQSPKPKGQPSQRTRAQQQLAAATDEQLEAAKALASENPQILRMIEREIARRGRAAPAAPAGASQGRMSRVKQGGKTYEIPEMWLVGRQQALAREGVPAAQRLKRAVQDWIDQEP